MLRIIIADDHPVIRQGLKRLLLEEFPPVHVEETTDGNSLVEKVKAESWDLVITDIAMPGGNGLDALKKIRQFTKELPILVISTYPVEQYTARVLKAGAQGFVSKDNLPAGLISEIRRVLKSKLPNP